MSRSETLRIRKAGKLTGPCVTAGDRAFAIGTEDGGFVSTGWHLPGEMGGVWAHPIKLLDGFWLQVDGRTLPPAHAFTAGPFWVLHEYEPADGLRVTRRQFVADGEPTLSVRYTFRSSRSRRLHLRFVAALDLQPVWSPNAELSDAGYFPSFDIESGTWLVHHLSEPWFVLIGSPSTIASRDQGESQAPTDGLLPQNGPAMALNYQLDVAAAGSAILDMAIAGSYRDAEEARASFQRLRGVDPLWDIKQARYAQVLSSSSLDVPDESLLATWDWLKCNNDWLVRDVPGVGRGLGAGLDDYPWWFGCDTAYSALGCLALGQHQVTIETIDLLRGLSERGNGPCGRVIHEATTSGEVVHPGNTQETPHFATAVWETFLWTGDTEFLHRNYDFCRRGVLGWLFTDRCTDGDLLPTGCGIIEIAGLDLQCIDVAAHTFTGLKAVAGMAETLRDDTTAEHARSLAKQVRTRLEQAFWIEEEGLYGDLLASPREFLERLAVWKAQASGRMDESGRDLVAAIEGLEWKARADPHPDERRAWLLGNWTLVTPLEAGITERDRASRILDRIETAEFIGPSGMYLSSLDRQHAMSINTGVLAGIEVKYGRPDQGLTRLITLASTLEAHMPGAISEMSPDYGCFVQAWSGYAIAWPIVNGMFGIHPDALHKRLELTPCFPSGWERGRLGSLPIGSAHFDFEWDGSSLLVRSDKAGWTATSPTHPVRYETRSTVLQPG